MPRANPQPLVRPGVKKANAKLAELNPGVELDVLGRIKAGPGTKNGYDEEQTYTHEDGTVEIRVRRAAEESRRCKATIIGKENPWRGNRCVKNAIRGGTVCPAHGGNLPGVRKAAQRRLAMAADPAAAKLIWIALHKKNVSDADRIKALLAVLDRAGVQGKTSVEIELKPWQQVLQKVYGSLGGAADPEDGTMDLEEGVDYVVTDDSEEVDD